MEKNMNVLDLQMIWQKIRMNGEEEFMWTTIRTYILVHVADPNLLGLRF